ncbi:MAG: hypothetical protein ACO3LE_05890 [Bdellovibrionota bacterium]
MLRALILSGLLHILLLGGLIWSAELSLLFLKSRQKDLEKLGVVEVDLLYKPTESAMRKGQSQQALPPPDVKQKAASEDDAPVIKPKIKPKPKEKPKQKKEPPKTDFSEIFNRMREETAQDSKKAPRDDNFPTSLEGQENARGTGGSATRNLSPAQQALQTAFSKYFEIPRRDDFARRHPDAKGFLSVRLASDGSRLRLVTLSWPEKTGFEILDRGCERAIRRAIEEETFAPDVISELNGKETPISCNP